jgi:hypothetical protein
VHITTGNKVNKVLIRVIKLFGYLGFKGDRVLKDSDRTTGWHGVLCVNLRDLRYLRENSGRKGKSHWTLGSLAQKN